MRYDTICNARLITPMPMPMPDYKEHMCLYSDIFYFVGDWVSWTVRTKVMTDSEMLAIRNMLTEASMDR